ncbi:ADP-ribosylglycohydrolase family protein [Streptomyces acidiscabies]|uniref:ADP-ribosylglycohydrolase family protein n=2 Tax=Streptomyces acidiscabies TaxID=42234 RepID=A0AAP6EEN2_9ACTN|nr:ADP-ribosylglycohydrolase family protein [Streptomyces acidiscabies]MBP5939261.1 ADP-ribosylglycohydrolase family protein [Streptomyces sp. LBUM 1476]MBZ3910391.1 ADP-ribosylglycohydrolase family protein [Streptomyces acidiscabies]MDX2959390.1 ADP-ribosylglycohydrolase family protein [Streptomyces acidiscabies]MDX3019322.1 ADP-ribosylglycohydrolase family protein [Streptomyces acidiscabies]MDX3790597.1 ADP-ribosylglycohydrolase family protein [Streptomyces acidiscabies]
MPVQQTPSRLSRAVGAVLGSAVGDALGAPFEFGPEGAFSARFPAGAPAEEMCGGGGWDPGEATDDTQMAVLVGESLLERGGLDLADVFGRFRRWAGADPKDIGLQTEAVLTSGDPWDSAAAIHFQVSQRAAGNGALMRAATSAVYFADQGQEVTLDAARRLSALTHGDAAAWEGTAALHELIRAALAGDDPLSAVPRTLGLLDAGHRARYATVLDPGWHPDLATEFNGAVWPCLGSAVWALRTTDTFAGALRAAVDLGGDTDTVAAVTGALAGAVYGVEAVPDRWVRAVRVPLPGFGGRVLGAGELVELARRLEGRGRREGVVPSSAGGSSAHGEGGG